MVTNIGNTSAKIVISDNATPASGTYAWYITCENSGFRRPLRSLVEADLAAEVDIMEKYFDARKAYWIRNGLITTAAEYDNMLDAIDYWEANNTRLYLSVKNEWNSNLATIGTKAAPTTQGQMRGKLKNYSDRVFASSVQFNIEFWQTSQ